MSFAGTPFNRNAFSCVTLETMAKWIDEFSAIVAEGVYDRMGDCVLCNGLGDNHYSDCPTIQAQLLRERLSSDERKLIRIH